MHLLDQLKKEIKRILLFLNINTIQFMHHGSRKEGLPFMHSQLEL